MRILPHATVASNAPVVTVVTPAEDAQELRALKERVQALENRKPAEAAAPADPAIPLAQLAQLKTDLETQWKSDLTALRKSFEAIEERLHSCEQSPKILMETVLKDMELRLRSQLTALEKTMEQRIDHLAAAPPAPAPVVIAPAVVPSEKPVPAPAVEWDKKFERQERALAELMKEITLAAPPTPVEAPPAVNFSPSVTTVTAPLEFSKASEPEMSFPETEVPMDFVMPEETHLTHRPSSRSPVVRFWKYLNAPAFGAERPD